MPDFQAFVRQHLPHLALPGDRECKIVEELAAQLEDAYDSLLARGLPVDDAWHELQRQLPAWTSIADALLEGEPSVVRLAQPERGRLAGRTLRRLLSAAREFLSAGVVRDLHSSLRLLVTHRGFTSTTILTLAICLGANAAIFTVVYAVLLRPLPVADPDRIVAMGDVYPTITPDDILSNDVPSYFDRREAITALDEQALFANWFDSLVIGGVSEELRGMRATPSLFRVLQVNPALGRPFTDAEGEPGADRKIILSHGLWQRLYGGDLSVIGRDLRLGWTAQRYTVVGVMPAGFSFFDRGDGHARAAGDGVQFWIPLAFTAAQRSEQARTRYGYFHIGRLRADASIDEVKAQLDALNAATFQRFPQFRLAELGMHTAVTPLHEALTRKVSRLLYLLWAGAACVLLIGALNIANLALARSIVRTRDLATRLALGASRYRVMRQLVLEGVLVAIVGGLAGLAVAAGILRALAAGGMSNVPNANAIHMDWIVIGAVMTASVVVGVLIGLVPAMTTKTLNVAETLAEGGRLGTGGRTAGLFRRGLVVAQVACSVVLLVGAGLLLTSVRNLLAVDAGFDASGVVTATIFPPPSRYPDQRAVVGLSNRLLDAVRSIPGVSGAGITSNIALSGGTSPSSVRPDAAVVSANEPPVLPSVVSVSPGYFESMGTRLVRGRSFNETDREDSLPVAIVDERLAERFWPRQDPVGKGIYRGNSNRYTIVGVVRQVRFDTLAAASASIGAAYFPHTQAPNTSRLRWVAIKSATDSAGVVRSLRAALTAIDPELPLADVQTMTERVSQSIAAPRLAMGVATTFGVVALLLSVIGIYGVLAYIVAQKTREIGIRIALGSTAGAIFRLFFKEGLTLIASGLTVGVAGAIVAGPVLEDQIFGVAPTDVLILGVVALAAGAIALLACVSPARRATRVDPLTVLNDS